ncbi:MAG: phosphoribosylanthranilate isomerase [Chloroflexaceae bacterium]|nr:phosphoribosylanthranilate isomerase [Chloroflexaceae bacterium]NJO04361.1 phosphoribosylanthranilate isomerase [Chloroflexaceae bacterium]
MTAVKICGIRTVEHALAAATVGADMIGLVFAPSRRQVTPEQATTLAAAVRQQATGRVKLVGLFVNASVDVINQIADQCDLDYVQLSGDELPTDAAPITRPLIVAVRLNNSIHDAAWLAHYQQQLARGGLPYSTASTLHPTIFRLLVDAHVPGTYGGTGTRADWLAAAELARDYPIMLAGGLTPANVAEAIAQVQPWGVDVSSGVETDNQKQAPLIAAFVQSVRAVL